MDWGRGSGWATGNRTNITSSIKHQQIINNKTSQIGLDSEMGRIEFAAEILF